MKRTKSTNTFISATLSMVAGNLIVSAVFEGSLLHAFLGIMCVSAGVVNIARGSEEEPTEKSVS